MADISDIVLRIRVDIVNTQAIAGLVNNLQRANTAVRSVSRSNAAATQTFSYLGDGIERTAQAGTRMRRVTAALIKGTESLDQTGKRSVYRTREQVAASRQLARGTAELTREKIREGASSRTGLAMTRQLIRGTEALDQTGKRSVYRTREQISVSRQLARGTAELTRAKVREGAASRTHLSVTRNLTRGTQQLLTATRQSSLADNEAYQMRLRLARGTAIMVAQGERQRREQERQSQSAARAAFAAEALRKRQRELYSTSALLHKATGALGSAFGKIVDPLSRVERKMDAVFRAGVHMQSMGRDLVGFAKKMIGFGKEMLDAWGDFEFTMNRAAAASDIFGRQTPMYKELKDAIYNASRELKLFPAEEVAKGVYYWQSTTGETIDTHEKLVATMKNVNAVMKLAAMTDSNYETTIKGVYSTLKQFNLGMDKTADVSALLFFATQKTALELPDLINAFKMTGAVMGQAEEPLQSMVAVLGAVGNAGFRGSQAGRALRQTYIKVVKPTKAAKEELNKLFKAQGGYNKVAFDSKGHFVGMEKYMMRMARATKDMTYKQRAHLLATITTANELPVMTQMLRMAERAVRSGNKSWTEFIVSQEKANKAFNESWNTISNSWRGVVGGLKQSVQPIMLEIGRIVAEMLTPTLQEMSDTIWEMGPVIEDMAKGLAETFKPFVEWVGKGIKKVMAWARANQKVVAAFAKYGVVATIVAGVAGAFLLLAGTVTLLIANLTIVMLGALPLIAVFVALGVALAALTVGFYRNTGGIKDALMRLWDAIKRVFAIWMGGSEDAAVTAESLADSFMKLSDSITKKFADIVNWIAGALEKLTPEQVSIIKKLVKALVALKLLNTGLGIVGSVIANLTGNIALMASGMKRATPKVINFLKAFSPTNIKKAIDGMNDLASSVSKNMKTIGDTLAKGAGTGAGAAEAGGKWAIAFVSGIAGAIGGAIVSALPAIGTALAGIVSAIVAAVGGWAVVIVAALVAAIVAAIGAAYATNFLGFKDFVDGIGRWITQVAIPAVQGFVQGIIDAFGGVVTWFQNLPANIGGFIQQVIDNIVTFGSDLVTTIVNALTEFASRWDYYLGVIVGYVISMPIKILMVMFEFGKNLGTTAVTFLTDLWNNFTKFFGDIWNGIVQWFATTIPQVAYEMGKFVGGIVAWVQQLPGKIATFFGQVWTNITTWFATNIPLLALEAAKFVNSVVTFVKELPGKVATFFGQVWTNITTWFTTNIPLIKTKAEELVNGIVNFFKNLPQNIITAIQNLPGMLINFFANLIVDGAKLANQVVQVGKDIVKGIWKGISGMVDWFKEKVANFFQGIVDGVKKNLGISSPSKVFAGIGEQMINGLAVGIEKTDAATSAMNNVISSLTGAVDDASMALTSNIGGQFKQSVTQDSTKTIELKVDVTSADGSVNSMDMATLAGLITGSDMTRTLERMSTVD